MKRSDESDFDMIWRLRGERNALRKRIDAAEAASARIADLEHALRAIDKRSVGFYIKPNTPAINDWREVVLCLDDISHMARNALAAAGVESEVQA